jgi:5'-3' exonuclease
MTSLRILTQQHWGFSIPMHRHASVMIFVKPGILILPWFGQTTALKKPHLTKKLNASRSFFRVRSFSSLVSRGGDAIRKQTAREYNDARLLLQMDDEPPLGLRSAAGLRNMSPPANGYGEGGGEEEQRMLLIDGNAVLYRSYFKIMARVGYGGLKDMGSEGDWVLTVFTSLLTILRLLEARPTHIAVVFDYRGLTFRHQIFRGYKSGRAPTPDTILQALDCIKPAILSMGITALEVPGVEADDVIGALALRAVAAAGTKVRIASPDKDFFQILSAQLRILRFAPKGSGIVSFGLEEFAQKFGSIQPAQYLDVLALMGDKVDSIPGVPGIGEKTALKLVHEFGSVENLLERRSEVVLKRARESLMLDEGAILLSKRLLTLRVDLPAHLLPYNLDDFVCQSPKDQGENFMKLLQAMSPYIDPSVPQDLEKRVRKIWKTWQVPQQALETYF